MRIPLLLLLAAALPALADTQFQVRRMTRNDVPIGKGQCDIRLQVDNEVEVMVRGDVVSIRTLSGQDARDDGSECNAPLPNRDIADFNFQVVDSRNDIALLSEPSPRSRFAAIVRIRDSSGGFGRYHFRLTWAMTGTDYRNLPGGIGNPAARGRDGFDGPRGAPGFAWNNTLNFRGNGRGEAWLNDFGPTRLGEVNINIDRGGRIVAWLRTERGRGLSFNGSVMAREGDRWKSDVMTEDRRYRGTLWFTVDPGGNVVSLSTEVTDGRDRMQVNWDRR
ncbi:MAG: hypothetical protein JST11_17475 [Acidobacteria bacterium]|nr:hypothetical protein [Acidobacteriota bacterium]